MKTNKSTDLLHILTLNNSKNIYIDGNSSTNQDAHEIIVSLTKTWGNDFEKQELTDKFFGIQPTRKIK